MLVYSANWTSNAEIMGRNSQRAFGNLQATCERGFAAMEETHQKKIEDLQRQHQRELEKLREEKDRLLAEETAATISGERGPAGNNPSTEQVTGSFLGHEQPPSCCWQVTPTCISQRRTERYSYL